MSFSVVIYTYAMVVLGLIAGAGWRELERMERNGEFQISRLSAFAGAITHSTQLWMGLCSSPLICCLVLQAVQGATPLTLTVIGLESGFCATAITSTFLKSNAITRAEKLRAGSHVEKTANRRTRGNTNEQTERGSSGQS